MTGVIRLFQAAEDAPTLIEGEVKGLTKGSHALAVCVWGNVCQGSSSCGPHFNPFGKTHGAPTEEERHVGSLGNIEADASGTATVHLDDALVKLIGPHSIIGRSLVVYTNADDLGKGGHDTSLINGNAGPGLASGIVGIYPGPPRDAAASS